MICTVQIQLRKHMPQIMQATQLPSGNMNSIIQIIQIRNRWYICRERFRSSGRNDLSATCTPFAPEPPLKAPAQPARTGQPLTRPASPPPPPPPNRRYPTFFAKPPYPHYHRQPQGTLDALQARWGPRWLRQTRRAIHTRTPSMM